MDRRQQDDTRPFRQRLDDVLRTRDSEAVRDFLIAAGQWDEDAAGDTEFAMWMMIAGSPALTGLHVEAEDWLRRHGHAAEADIITGSRKRQGQQGGGSRLRGGKQNGGPRGPQGSGQASRHRGQHPSHPSRHHPGQRPPHRSGPSQPRP